MTHGQEKNYSIETDTQMTFILQSADRNFKITMINMLKSLKGK